MTKQEYDNEIVRFKKYEKLSEKISCLEEELEQIKKYEVTRIEIKGEGFLRSLRIIEGMHSSLKIKIVEGYQEYIEYLKAQLELL